MAAPAADSLFVDTSIQIARQIHRPEIQESIAARLSKHSEVVSGLIVRQEIKRRLLKEAIYLLKQLNERKSFEKVQRHVADSLPPQQSRKRNINLDLLMTIDEMDEDTDRYDRARLMLRDLIKNGIATAEASLTRVTKESGCACAQQPITEKRPYFQYEFGADRCTKADGKCQIRQFLESKREVLQHIYDYLSAEIVSGNLTDELKASHSFIGRFLQEPEGIEKENPCLVVGDLMIALESVGCSTMYTMNWKESRHFAKVLGQSLIYRPPNSDNPELAYSSGVEWLLP